MLSSDVFCASSRRHHAGLLSICSAWYRFVLRFLRNILDKRSQRSGRCARRWHSHHQRWGQPCTRGRKERILHLDCRGSCAALSFPLFPLSVSVSLFLSFCLPLFLLHLWPLPPSWPQGTCRQSTDREVPQVFSCYCLLLSPSSIIYISSFISLSFVFFLFLAASFHRQLAVAAEVVPLVISFPIFDMNSWISVYLPWLLLTWPLVGPLSLSLQADTQTHTILPFVHTRPQTHIIFHINTVPKNTDAIELLSMPSCIVCQ